MSITYNKLDNAIHTKDTKDNIYTICEGYRVFDPVYINTYKQLANSEYVYTGSASVEDINKLCKHMISYVAAQNCISKEDVMFQLEYYTDFKKYILALKNMYISASKNFGANQ